MSLAKAENFHRNSNEQSEQNTDFDYFITTDLPIEHIYQMLKLKGDSENEIEETIKKVRTARHQIQSIARKFMSKINTVYSHLDIPELMKKGLKHADRKGLSEAQKKVFIRNIMKGDIYNEYSYDDELAYTDMSKFMGFDGVHGQMIKMNPKDHSKLNELYALYDQNKMLHSDVKTSTQLYRDCAPEAIKGEYDKSKHNVSVHIHPVIAALFIPKIEYLERRMLLTNIARMILSRAHGYLKNYNFHLQSNVSSKEIDSELELAYDIAYDPNSLTYFANDSPIDNIIKRFKCQLALYKCVLNLRQGRYYGTSHDHDNDVTGFIKMISSYEWTFFDSPLYNAFDDEGTILRKLLSVFSCRPTFTQLSSFGNRYGLGHTNITNLAKTTFVNIQVINVKLPTDLIGNTVHEISLNKALSQLDYFVENKMVVPKNKSIIYSNEVCFFYANRRYPSVNFTSNSCLSMRMVNMPTSIVNTVSVNNSKINFGMNIRIGRDAFSLRSVVMLQKPVNDNIEMPTGGCAAGIVIPFGSHGSQSVSVATHRFIYYNPSLAAIQYLDNDHYEANKPFSFIRETTNQPNRIGFRTEARERGTIFFYVKQTNANSNC